MKIAEHVLKIMEGLETIRPMTTKEREYESEHLYEALRSIQRYAGLVSKVGDRRTILSPIHEQKQAFVEKYLNGLKPSDIKDD